MSKKLRVLAAVLTVLAVPVAAMAQEEEAATSFAYGTYFECDANDEWLADAIVDQLFAPTYDAAVADGTITAWGWLSHRAGGKWRRAIYHLAPTIDGVLDASGSLAAKAAETNADAALKFSEICGAHDDYIWTSTHGSGGAGSAEVAMVEAKAGVSVYMVCDMAREDRADELVATFAPVYDRHVAAGDLAAWGWLSHVVGGEYRRLLNMRGADHGSLMSTWGAIIEELGTNHGDAMAEFSQICPSHQDYLWDIR